MNLVFVRNVSLWNPLPKFLLFLHLKIFVNLSDTPHDIVSIGSVNSMMPCSKSMVFNINFLIALRLGCSGFSGKRS